VEFCKIFPGRVPGPLYNGRPKVDLWRHTIVTELAPLGNFLRTPLPEMNMYLDLNLATFQYIDGFGCYHFCLNRIGLELNIFFRNSLQLSVQFWDCRLQFWDCRLTVDCGHLHIGSHFLQAQCCVALSQPNKESNWQSSAQ